MKALFLHREAGMVKRLVGNYEPQISRLVLKAFRYAYHTSEAYRAFLEQQGVRYRRIGSLDAFLAEVPTIDKESLFGKYPLNDVFSGFARNNSGRIWSSSGSSNRLTIGFESKSATPNTLALDFFLNFFFQTLDRKSLFINTLPDGWPINGRYLYHAHLGTRVDIAIELLDRLSSDFSQFIIGGEPLLLKKLVEQAKDDRFDFSTHRIHFVAGGDYVAKSYKSYVRNLINPRDNQQPFNQVVSVMGMSEFGVATFFETQGVSKLQCLVNENPDLAERFKGPYGIVPQLFQYDPFTTFVETKRDDEGNQRLVMTNLNTQSELPLIRYDTGDLGTVFSHKQILQLLREHGESSPFFRLPLPVVAATGKPRHVDTKSNSRFSVNEGTELLFSEHKLLCYLTGYFRLIGAADSQDASIEIQLKHGVKGEVLPVKEVKRIEKKFNDRGVSVIFKSFGDFPDSIDLRYDRKFNYIG